MKNKQLKAFTLLELLIVMLLSSLVLAVAYLALQLVNAQYLHFSRNTEETVALSVLRTQLAKDLERTSIVWRRGGCLVLEKYAVLDNSARVEYCFQDSLLLRRQEQLTDTFRFAATAIVFSWEGAEQSQGPVDQISFNGKLNGESYPFLYRKDYDAQMKWQLTNQLP